MPWKMYLIESTPFCRRSLRRHHKTHGVASDHYHDASVIITEQFESPGTHGRGMLRDGYENHPIWPKTCQCGYAFIEEDYWQVNEERLWKGAPDGKLYALREHPPGATWVCDWFPEEPPNGQWTGPDGKVYAVMLPDGLEWIIYSYASGPPPRSKWTVEGTPPGITVSPSIHQVGHYHGFIKGGVISEDCEGRPFPGILRTA